MRLSGHCPPDWKEVKVLVNNAGNAHGLDLIHEGSPEDWDAMLDINVKGLLYVSKAITPRMVERKNGHIVNISSIADLEVLHQGKCLLCLQTCCRCPYERDATGS